MSFLRNLRKKVEGVAAQVNPFDSGQTYSSVVNQPIHQPRAPQSISVGRVQQPRIDGSSSPAMNISVTNPKTPQSSNAPRTRSPDIRIKAPSVQDVARKAASFAPQVQMVKGIVMPAMKAAGRVDEAIVKSVPEFSSTSKYRFLNNAVIRPYKETQGHIGQFMQGKNPYEGGVRQQSGQALQDVINVASIIPVGRAANLVTKGLPAIKQGFIEGAKIGAGFGAAQGVATSQKQNLDPRETLKTVASNTLLGGGAGGVLGGAIPAVGAGVRGIKIANDNLPVNAKVRTAKNDLRIMSDWADYRMKRYQPDANTINQLSREARRLGEKHGIELINGSPYDVDMRVAEFLERLDNEQGGLLQGGYVKIPGAGRGQSPVNRPVQPSRLPEANRLYKQVNASPLPESIAPDPVKTTGPLSQSKPLQVANSTEMPSTHQGVRPSLQPPLELPQSSPGIAPQPQTALPKDSILPQANNTTIKGLLPAPESLTLTPSQAKKRFKALNRQSRPFTIDNTQKPGIGITVSPEGAAKPGLDSGLIKVKQVGGETKVQVGHVTVPRDLVGNPKQWKDVGSTMKTMDRNIEAAAPTPEQYRKIHDFVIAPRGEAVTAMVDEKAAIKAELKKAVEAYGLKNKEVRADVMRYGEGKIDAGQLAFKHGDVQAGKIIAADRWFRAQYDRLLDETNAVLRKFNQPEIPRRDNYYTHFSDDNLWASAGLKIKQALTRGDSLQDATAIGQRTQNIDPKLLGQSEFTKPNKRYNPFAQQRKGDQTKYDAVEAFERYLLPTLHNKHLTESVVKTRMVTKAFQDATADSRNLPNFIRQLQEYGNDLAGKTNRFDRPLLETNIGSKALAFNRYMQQQMGRNTILGSVRSTIMQTAALPLSMKEAGYKNTALGLLSEMSSKVTKNDVLTKSPFLRRRYADMDSVLPSKLRKAEGVAAYAFEAIESTATKAIWRALHTKAISQGLTGQQAIKEADRLTERMVGGRQVGEKAEAFRSIIGTNALQFQLEVNNFAQEVMRDTKVKDPVKIAKLFAATYLFNSLVYEPLIGDRPLPDPVDAAIETYENFANGEAALGVGRLPAEVLSNMPGGSVLAGMYPEYGPKIGDKRLPSREQLFGDTEAGRYGGSFAAQGAVQNPLYLIPKTFGLKQAERTYGGVKGYLQGESASSKGETRFKIAQTPQNAIKAGLFGLYGTNEGKEYLDEQSDKLRGVNTGSQDDFDTKQAFSGNKEFVSLKNDEERRNWALKSPENADIYKAYQLAKKYDSAKEPVDLPKHMFGTPASKFLKEESRFTEKGKSAWYKKPPIKEYVPIIESAQKSVPEGWAKLPNNNKVASEFIKLHKNLEKAPNELERDDLMKEFARKAYQTSLTDNQAVFFSGSKYNNDQKIAALESGKISLEDFKKAVDLDNMLIEYGLSSSPAISNKLRSAFGLGTASSRGGGGRSKKGGITLPSISIADATKMPETIKISSINAPNGASRLKKPGIKIAKKRTVRMKGSKVI